MSLTAPERETVITFSDDGVTACKSSPTAANPKPRRRGQP